MNGSFCGNHLGGVRLALPPRADRPGQVGTDWNEIGLKIAIAGGMYPMILAACVLVATTCLWWLGGPALAPMAHGVLLQMLATLAAGFPYLLFSCFLLSTLIAVPVVGIVADIAKRRNMRLSHRLVTVFGGAFVASVWTLMLICAAIWWA